MNGRRVSSLSRRQFLMGTGGAFGAAALGGLTLPFAGRRVDAALLPDAGTVVETTSGKIRGGLSDGIHIFRGVPYGADTGGKNRFLPPRPARRWSGIRDTLEYGDGCPQTAYDLVKPAGIAWFTPFYPQTYSEDCLRLNVWTPAVNSGGKRPVLVWLHGGGFSRGSGSGSAYEGTNIAKRGDVVSVTVNHRLNVFGYTHFGDVFGEDYDSSGNAGMLDIVQALEWVRDNIENFGGDPGNVMIFGESGGGMKVSTLLGMPAAKGLFHRAVIQSGPGLTAGDPEVATRAAKGVLEDLGLKSSDLAKLQAVSADRLLGSMPMGTRRARGRVFRPILGSALPEHPFDPAASELSAEVPIMIGTNQHERTLFSTSNEALFRLGDDELVQVVRGLVGDRAEEFIATYREIAPEATASDIYFTMGSDQWMRNGSIRLAERKHAQGAARVYMYRFDWRSPAWEGRFMAAHAFEIPFVFDNTQLNSDITGGTPESKGLGAIMSDAWIAFARSGDPNHGAMPEWPEYTPNERATMLFNVSCAVENDPGGAARELWMSMNP